MVCTHCNCVNTCTVNSAGLSVRAKNTRGKPSHDISHPPGVTSHCYSPLGPGMQKQFSLSWTPLLSLSSTSLWKWEWRSISEGIESPTLASEMCDAKSQLPKWNSSMWRVGSERLAGKPGLCSCRPVFCPNLHFPLHIPESFKLWEVLDRDLFEIFCLHLAPDTYSTTILI